MEALREYLNSLSQEDQKAFAKRCNTSVSYLRKAISRAKTHGDKIGMLLAVDLERGSDGKIRREQLLPDVDWAKFQPTKKYSRTNAAA
jgi:DNA-binding transcriptional regulator YdaS (Cro superfamily)